MAPKNPFQSIQMFCFLLQNVYWSHNLYGIYAEAVRGLSHLFTAVPRSLLHRYVQITWNWKSVISTLIVSLGVTGHPLNFRPPPKFRPPLKWNMYRPPLDFSSTLFIDTRNNSAKNLRLNRIISQDNPISRSNFGQFSRKIFNILRRGGGDVY